MIIALQVVKGQSKASDFIYSITYLAQSYRPPNQLGYIYHLVNQSLANTRKLLKLPEEPTVVNDLPGAAKLVVKDSQIEFGRFMLASSMLLILLDNFSFSYNGGGTALNGVSFKVPKGLSVGLVGESRAGKSTVLRLFYRFYNLKEGEGRILIDSQDIREVELAEDDRCHSSCYSNHQWYIH